MELETARLRLRPFTPADGDGLFAILGDRETMAYSFPMIRGESDRFLDSPCSGAIPRWATPWRRRACPAWRAMYCSALWRIQGRMSWAGSSAGTCGAGGTPVRSPGPCWITPLTFWGCARWLGETIDLRPGGQAAGAVGHGQVGGDTSYRLPGPPGSALPVRRHCRAVAAEEAAGLFRRGKPPGLGPLSDLPAPGGGVGELRQPDGWGEQIRGIQAYLGRIQAAYEGRDGQFRCERIERDAGQIAAWLVSDRGERSRERFQFQDGLIWREWEDLTDEV